MSNQFEICSSSLKGAIGQLDGKWTFLILAELRQETCQFNQLKRKLGISTKTLSNDLVKLEKRGLINREVKNTRPITVEYSLTDKSYDLDNILIELMKWNIKWHNTEETI